MATYLRPGWVDEVHFGVHPVTVAPARTALRLLAADRMANGAVALSYAPA